MHLWRLPALSIHGVEGAFHEPGTKTVIPGRVTGKFSIRLVPDMDASVVEKQVRVLRGPLSCMVPHPSQASSFCPEGPGQSGTLIKPYLKGDKDCP